MKPCCAWCGDSGREEPAAKVAGAEGRAAPRSHGICQACLDLQLEALRLDTAARGTWIAPPLLAPAV